LVQKRKEDASVVKFEKKLLLKRKEQIDKAYLRMNKLRHDEVYHTHKEGVYRAE